MYKIGTAIRVKSVEVNNSPIIVHLKGPNSVTP